MFIMYWHISDPDNSKIYNTENSLCQLKHSCFYAGQTQEEFDAQELARFEADRERGIILKYEIME